MNKQRVVAAEQICADLQLNMGVKAGDILCVHSSLKSLGMVAGGPITVIEGLLAAVGGVDEGTLIMPCFSDVEDVVDLRTKPCRLGAIPEAFRTYPGVLRSWDPTHSVAAIGRFATEIVSVHRNTTPLGKGSPLDEIAKRCGHILHIGCDLRTCSLIHVAEASAPAPYLHLWYNSAPTQMSIITESGEQVLISSREMPGCSRTFLAFQEALEAKGQLLHGTVGEASCIKAAAKDILDTAIPMIQQDPSVTLCEYESCTVCSKRRKFLATPQD